MYMFILMVVLIYVTPNKELAKFLSKGPDSIYFRLADHMVSFASEVQK